MENKKYLDKVIGSLVRGTKIDYDREEIYFPSFPYISPHHFLPSSFSYSYFDSSFSKYCKNMFGLTEEEIEYVWEEYITIIKDKISNKES